MVMLLATYPIFRTPISHARRTKPYRVIKAKTSWNIEFITKIKKNFDFLLIKVSQMWSYSVAHPFIALKILF